MNTSFLAAYYTDPEFVKWVTKHNFTLISPDNVGKYYSLYNHERVCNDKRCHECAGIKLEFGEESDIANGRLKQSKCIIRDLKILENRGVAFSKRAVFPKAFDGLDMSGSRIKPNLKEEIDKYILNYPDNNPPGLYLYSAERRIGRTTLLWHIVKSIVRKNKIYDGFVFCTSSMFSQRIITDSNNLEEGTPFFREATLCDLLVLDDFGQEKYTEGYTTRLLAIMEERYWNKRPMLMSSLRPAEQWSWEHERDPEVLSKVLSTTKIIKLESVDGSTGY